MQAKITFYEINRCGFYKYSQNRSIHLFGNIGDTLSDLIDWTRDAPLEETKVHGSIDDIIGTYLSSLTVDSNSNSYLLVLWNEVFSSDASVLSLKGNSLVGQPQQLIENDIEKGSIPGYPTCFWILPEQNLLATVVFDKGVAGKKALEKYLFHFLRNCSSYAHKEEQGGETVICYIHPQDSTIQTCRQPIIRIKPYYKTAKEEFFQAQLPNVRKILVKSTFNVNQTVPLEGYKRLLDWLGFSMPSDYLESNQSYQIEMSVDEASFNFPDLYEKWQNEYQENNIDYGFKLTGDSTKYWFSGAIAKGDFDLTGLNINDMIERPTQILTQLVNQRARILSVLR